MNITVKLFTVAVEANAEAKSTGTYMHACACMYVCMSVCG